MGSKLAHAAHYQALGGTITDRARLVLNHMCWASFDDPKEDRASAEYWGGHITLGEVVYGFGNGSTDTARQAIRRTIKELIAAGLIEKLRDGDGRDRTVYKVLIGGRWKPSKAVDNSHLNGHEHHSAKR